MVKSNIRACVRRRVCGGVRTAARVRRRASDENISKSVCAVARARRRAYGDARAAARV